MQTYELLRPCFDLVAFATRKHYFETDSIGLTVRYLHQPLEAGLGIPKWQGVCNLLSRRLCGSEQRLLGLARALAGFDLVHAAETHHYFSWQALQTRQRTGARVVLTVWENLPFQHEDEPHLAWIKQAVRREADLFLAVTEQAGKALRLEGVEEERIRVVGAGIDTERFRPGAAEAELCRRLGVPEDGPVVLFAGSLLRAKGVYDLVLAARHLKADPDMRRVPFRLVLVGHGPEEGGLRGLVRRLGLEDTVVLGGGVPYHDMPGLHRLADVFVLPSLPTPTWQEQFGMVLAESMATGKAVVATRSGAIPEVVGDAGLLVPAADPVYLAEAIKTLLQNEPKRAELGRAARRRVEALYDRRLVATRIAQAYADLLEAR
jgi:glycosyltransferase involved in cell wall biosynthesis